MENKRPDTETGNNRGHWSPGGVDSNLRLAHVAARARKSAEERFSNLMHHLTPELIAKQLDGMTQKSAAGIDGITVEQARKNVNWLLRIPMEQIHKGQYEAPPVRRIYIPKANNGRRPIGIPTVIDRALQAGMAEILNQIYEQDFLKCSFGFRPRVGCHNALATIGNLIYKHGMNYALEVDIREFFGNLSHKWLRKFLEHRISDRRVLKLVEAWLRAGVMEEGKWYKTDGGVPQGGSISPLLANIYLHYVVDLWFEKVIKKQLRGKANLVRYCDDFVILFQNQEDVDYVHTLLRARLGQFGLEMAEEKTHRTDLTPRENNGSDRRRMTFLGFSIYKSKKWKGKGYKVSFQTEGKRYARAKKSMKEVLRRIMHMDLKKQSGMINSILRGHINYYGIAGNSSRICSFCYEVERYWRRCLGRRSQRGKLSWAKMREMLNRYPLVQPKIRIGYQLLGAYAML